MLRSEILEQRTLNQRVVGSSPTAPTIEIIEIADLFGTVKERTYVPASLSDQPMTNETGRIGQS
jgi:hypothetical protein